MSAEHILPSSLHPLTLIGAETAGTAYVIARLLRALGEAQAACILVSTDPPGHPSLKRVDHRSEKRDFAGVPGLRYFYLSAEMKRDLRRLAPMVDVIHGHGLWQQPTLYAADAARRFAKPLVLSPHGMLSPGSLRFSRARKWLLWRTGHGRAMRDVAMFHATSEAEYADIRALGFRQPIALIPFGIDVPEMLPVTTARRTLLSLGRIHPVKGLDRLLAAWQRIEARHPDFDLEIAGPDHRGHLAELQALVAREGIARVRFLPPSLGEDKWRLYRNAAVFVLPTSSENFGMVVAESLASATPAICTTGAPWEGLRTHGCGWWVDQGVEPLADALDQALSLGDEERAAMGLRGRKWIEEDFGWQPVAQRMLAAYRWIGAGGTPPEFVRLD